MRARASPRSCVRTAGPSSGVPAASAATRRYVGNAAPHVASSRTLPWTWPPEHQASSRDSWVSLRNRTSTCVPLSDEPVSTANPLLGVAQSSDATLPRQLTSAVPPTRPKVRATGSGVATGLAVGTGEVAGGVGEGDGAVAGVGDGAVDEDGEEPDRRDA